MLSFGERIKDGGKLTRTEMKLLEWFQFCIRAREETPRTAYAAWPLLKDHHLRRGK
ncbi:MAG: hypothetical protein Q7U03_10395 [Syntrophales bacterium]|nr:hypothetical protein [Syntrophales bacterium]